MNKNMINTLMKICIIIFGFYLMIFNKQAGKHKANYDNKMNKLLGLPWGCSEKEGRIIMFIAGMVSATIGILDLLGII